MIYNEKKAMQWPTLNFIGFKPVFNVLLATFPSFEVEVPDADRTYMLATLIQRYDKKSFRF